MHIAIRIALWLLAVFFVLLTGSFAYLRNADLSVYETQIEGFLSERIGHKVDFDGLFELHFGNVTYVKAEDVRITNPDWPSNPVILDVGYVSVSVELWSLFRGPIVIQELDLQRVTVHLERNERYQGNWETAAAETDSQPRGGFDPGNFVAFRQMRVQDVQFGFTDPNRRRPLQVDLEYLTVSPDATNVLDLDLRATINETPFRADGRSGPWTHLLDGKDILVDLNLVLGDSSLSVSGHIDDLFRLEGVETSLKLYGSSIDRVIDTLGIPPFATGEFEVTASIDAEDTGTLVSLEGNLGEITLFASGSIDRFLGPGSAEFDFRFAGPDAKYVAEVFGLDNVTQAPFRVSGQFDLQGARYSLANVEAQFATGVLGLDGWLDLSRPIPDGDITISSSGPDLSAIGAFSGVPGIPAEAFDWQGRVRKTGAAWRFDDFRILIGDNMVEVSGELDPSNAADDQIVVTATGPDVSILGELTGLQGIPARPFDISARIRPDAAGMRLEDAVGAFGENLVRLDGVLGVRDGLHGTDLDVRASGPELHNVALLTGVPFLPTGPFEFAAHATISRNKLTIEDATAVVTGIDAAVDGSISLVPAGREFALQFSANGADFAGLAEFDVIEQFAGEPFEISGQISRDGNEFELNKFSAAVGTLRTTIDGDFAGDGSAFDIRVRADAPDADVLKDFARIEDLPPGPVVVAGRVERLRNDLEFRDTEFSIGEYRFSADGTLSNAPLSNDSDLRFSASGPELRGLGLPFGLELLPVKAFAVSGQVNGTPTGFAVENLVARIGENDVVAAFTAELGEKPEITGFISSTYIDLESELLQSSKDTGEKADTGREFLFSDEPLRNSWLNSANVDIDVKAERAILRRADVHDVHVHVRLWDGKLDIDPLTFGEMDGSVTGQFHMEPDDGGFSLNATLSMDNMHLGLKASPDGDRTLLPPLGGRFEISGSGKSLHEIMASSNGKLDLRQGAGRWRATFLSAFLGDLVTEVMRTINPLSESQSYTKLHCGIFRWDIVDGIATIIETAMQSDRLTVIASGSVNFKNERLDLTVRSKPRKGFGISLGGVINSFLKLGGTLQKPRLNIDPASSVTTTGAAVATGGLSLLARGLWDRLSAETDLCAQQGDDKNQE